jgi:hypothetical protein
VISTVIFQCKIHLAKFTGLKGYSLTLAEATQNSDIRRMNGSKDLHAFLFTVLTVSRLSPDGVGTTVPVTLVSALLLSECQGQRTGGKGAFATSLTELQNICHSARCPLS